MSTIPTVRVYPPRRRADCFVCKRRPLLIAGTYLSPHVDKAGHVCPGSGEVAS